jgi:hypothetical protein
MRIYRFRGSPRLRITESWLRRSLFPGTFTFLAWLAASSGQYDDSPKEEVTPRTSRNVAKRHVQMLLIVTCERANCKALRSSIFRCERIKLDVDARLLHFFPDLLANYPPPLLPLIFRASNYNSSKNNNNNKKNMTIKIY